MLIYIILTFYKSVHIKLLRRSLTNINKFGGRAMSVEFKKGDKVEWESSQGTIKGTVEKKLTQPIEIKGHHVAASNANPEYLVKSDKTGKEAAHKPESLKDREK